MRQFPGTIQKIIEESGLNLNNISQASGISNGYLAKLFKGRINRPGKDKITSILIALNYTITQINDILSSYDYQPLHVDDIPEILKNNQARKIVGGNLPQYDHIYFDLLLVVLERIGGRKIMVKNRPSGVFMPRELYLQKEYPYEANDSAAIFRYQLTEAILNERHEVFVNNCRAGNGTETFICRDCFAEYIERQFTQGTCSTPGHELLVLRYLANALSLTMKQPHLHKTYIMERCPYFHYLLQDVDGPSPKVSYPGRKLHNYDNIYDKQMLEGFTTDLPHIVAHFKQEVEMCRGAVLPEFREYHPSVLKEYIQSHLQPYGLAGSLERELSPLMRNDELKFY